MKNSSSRIPVDTGLARSKVRKKIIKSFLGNKLFVYYDGPDYIVPLHEIPAPPDKSPAGRSAKHPQGEYKFLERAVDEEVKKLDEIVRKHMKVLEKMKFR